MDQPTSSHAHQQALALLSSRIDYERTENVPYRPEEFKLDRMRDLLDQLGNPQSALEVVHIAGTKGKGSTAMMIGAVLTAAGYRTGLYTSPHLYRVEERAAIDGRPCSPDELVDLISAIAPVVRQMDRQVQAGTRNRGPTFFEITTAMALLHFARQAVDFAVLEVGLGGRLDSTNVCQPLVSVITSISFDHTRQLGNTLVSIAREKAGIIKPGVPVVSGVVQREPCRVIQRTARAKGCPLYQLGREFDYQYDLTPPAAATKVGAACRAALKVQPGRLDLQRSAHHARISRDKSLTGPERSDRGGGARSVVRRGKLQFRERAGGRARRLDDVALRLIGRHQGANAAVALATLSRLEERGWPIPEHAIRAGLAQVRCPARVEVVCERPTVVIDAAHNVASVEALVTALDEHFTADRRLLVFATSRDKDAEAMLRRLLPRFHYVVLTRYVRNPRHVMPDELSRLAAKIRADMADPRLLNLSVTTRDEPRSAWEAITSILLPDDLVCVAGSSFIAGEIRPLAVRSRPLHVVW